MKLDKIRYSVPGKNFVGTLIYDDTVKARRPAILFAPSWMGAQPQAFELATEVAEAGYVVMVADMYGEGVVPKDHAEAAPLARPLREDRAEMRRRVGAAFEAFNREAEARGIADGRNRAAIGFCFGGGNVLELARSGADLQAVVSFHGDLRTTIPGKPGEIKAAILILHGSADPVAPREQREGLESELEPLGVKWRMVTYGGVVHSFTDRTADTAAARYDEAACRDSFAVMHGFLKDAFAGQL